MRILIEQEKMEVKKMNISKDELYKIAEEVVEEKTKFVHYIFLFFLILSAILSISGIVLSNFKMALISLLIAVLIVYLTKIFERIKKEHIRKVIENYDESGI